MKVIKFKGCNATYAKDQPEYLSLPSHKSDEGAVTSCWQLSFCERIHVAFKGRLFLQVLTFNQPLQPLKMSANNPLKMGRTFSPRKIARRIKKTGERIVLIKDDTPAP